MRIELQFWDAYSEIASSEKNPDLVPSYLAIAAATVLPVDGASISFVHENLRLPLGADSTDTDLAERLQFTVGDGPCMQAGMHNVVVDAPNVILRARWPILASEWEAHTPYRAATSIPIPLPEPSYAALNLFFTGPDNGGLRAVDASVVAALIGAELVATSPTGKVTDLLRAPQPTGRLQVWVAVGLLMQAHDLAAGDALDRLRSQAYANDQSVEALAAMVVDDPVRAADFAL